MSAAKFSSYLRNLWFTLLRDLRFLFVLGLVQPAVADEGAEGGRPGDVEAGEAVEESAAEDIGAEEAPRGAKHGGADGKARAACLLLADEEIGERIDLRDVRREGGKRMVMEIAAERGDVAVAFDFLV